MADSLEPLRTLYDYLVGGIKHRLKVWSFKRGRKERDMQRDRAYALAQSMYQEANAALEQGNRQKYDELRAKANGILISDTREFCKRIEDFVRE